MRIHQICHSNTQHHNSETSLVYDIERGVLSCLFSQRSSSILIATGFHDPCQVIHLIVREREGYVFDLAASEYTASRSASTFLPSCALWSNAVGTANVWLLLVHKAICVGFDYYTFLAMLIYNFLVHTSYPFNLHCAPIIPFIVKIAGAKVWSLSVLNLSS